MTDPLIAAALHARQNAHAPFSKFRVGAALEDAKGQIHTGCNIENATYGLTVCAERIAIFKAISEGARHFQRIAVVADTPISHLPAAPAARFSGSSAATSKSLWQTLRDTARTSVSVLYSQDPSMLRSFSLLLLVAGVVAAAPCDLIFSARYVVTMSGQRRVIENGAVAVRGERIVAVGTRAEIDRNWQPARRIDRPNALLAPGLINTHTHAAMSLFRGIADDLKLQDWLNNFIFPAEAKNVSPDFVRWGTRLGCLEMLLSGTTTFTDMYYFEDVVAETAKEAGMRGVLGEIHHWISGSRRQNACRRSEAIPRSS